MLSDKSPLQNNDPGYRHYAVTKSDTNNIRGDGTPCRALRIGGAGDVAVVDGAGTTIVYTCVDGEILPFRAVRVNSTGTTATNIVAWY